MFHSWTKIEASRKSGGENSYAYHIAKCQGLGDPVDSSGLPLWLSSKESACSAGDLGSIPGLGRSPGVGKGYPLQYSGLENSMDCIIHGVAKSWTQQNDFHFHAK